MKLSEMYPRKYATGGDLAGHEFTLTLDKVRTESMVPSVGTPAQLKFVLYFREAEKGVILSRTLASQIAQITGQDDTDKWPGLRITIFPVPLVVAGVNRIAIRAKAPVNGTSTPPAAMVADEEEEV